MTTEHPPEKPVRLQRVLGATPACENRVAMSPTTLGPIFCLTCQRKHQQAQPEAR